MLFARMWRAAMFDRRVFQELSQDPIALMQAITVLLLSLSAVIAGAVLDGAISDLSTGTAVAQALIVMPGIWILPATSLLFLGSLAQKAKGREKGDRDLFIVIGFSAAPGLLLFFLFVPGLSGVVATIAPLWSVVILVTASRAVLGVSTLRAIAFIAPGFLLFLLVGVVLASAG